MTIAMLVALGIFIAVYVAISAELLNKTVVVLLGAAVFLAAGFIHGPEPFVHVDLNVIFLLLSMMIIVGVVKRTGFSQFVAIKAAKAVGGDPVKILVFFILITAVFSALLGTVTTIMLIVPVSILICVELGISPMPFMIAEPMAANIGGLATVVGDATTIMVGSAFKVDFIDYMAAIDPVLVLILAVFTALMVLFFRRQLVVSNEDRARIMDFDESKSIEDRPLMWKSLVVVVLVIAGFVLSSTLGVPVSVVSLLGASALMVLAGGHEIDRFLKDVEWGTILFFVGLFTLVGGIVDMGLIGKLGELVSRATGGDLRTTSVLLVWVSGIVSALVDNVPYVATMIPLVQHLGEGLTRAEFAPLWISLLLGADLGGNGTLVGATANVIAAGIAGKSGHPIRFMTFTKYGAVVTLVNLAIVTAYVLLRYHG